MLALWWPHWPAGSMLAPIKGRGLFALKTLIHRDASHKRTSRSCSNWHFAACTLMSHQCGNLTDNSCMNKPCTHCNPNNGVTHVAAPEAP